MMMNLKFRNASNRARNTGIGLCAVFVLAMLAWSFAARGATTNMPGNTTTNTFTNMPPSTATNMSTNVPPPAAASPAENGIDANVLSKMHAINLLEIKAGTMARQKGNTEEVRAYGNRLENDHQLSEQMLKALARSEHIGVQAPAKMTQQAAALINKLESLSGGPFDQAFIKAMIQGHTQAIQMLMQARGKLGDPQVRKFVGKMIPILKQHLQLAKDIESGKINGDINQQPTE